MTGSTLQGLSAAVARACGVPEPREPEGAVDWPEFVRLVDRHHVAPLVQRSSWLAEVGAPSAVCVEMRERARSDARRSLRVLALQREVLGLLATAGVDVIVLKGPTLARDAYDDLTARAPRDLDVLVQPDALPRALGALRSAGLEWHGWRRPGEPGPPAEPETFERLSRLPLVPHVSLTQGDIEVELHCRLFANARLMPVDPDWVSHPRLLEIQGTAVPALPLRAQWQYLFVHGASHLWSRMKWLADVPAFALRHPHLAHPDALTAAGPGYRRSLATGLLTAEAAFGRFLPPETRAWAERAGGTRLLIHRSLAALRADANRPARIMPRAIPGEIMGRLAVRPDARYRREEVRQLLLEAGRSHEVADPGFTELAAAPLRWTRRAFSSRARGPGLDG